MKRSNKILLISGLVLVLLIIALGGFFSYKIGQLVKMNMEKSDSGFVLNEGVETKRYDFVGFSRIKTKGNWRIFVRYGDSYSIEIQTDKLVQERVRVKQRDDTLYLEFLPGSRFVKERAVARIVMPGFNGVTGEDGLDLYFEGFSNMDTLSIDFSGGLTINGSKSNYNQLYLDVNGGGNINLRNVSVYNANVRIDGAGNVVLLMGGGVLRGEINGAGILTYYGNVKKRDVSINGVGKIYHK